MALIKCPECGKEISDKANSCIHCGYPIIHTPKADNSEKSEYITSNDFSEEFNKQTIDQKEFNPAESFREKSADADSIRTKKSHIKTGIVVAIIAIVICVAVIIFSNNHSFPYGITQNMTIDQVTTQLQTNGFRYSFRDGPRYYFEGGNVFGITPSDTLATGSEGSYICIYHFFRESQRDTIRNSLIKKYGQPNASGHAFADDGWHYGDFYILLYGKYLQYVYER